MIQSDLSMILKDKKVSEKECNFATETMWTIFRLVKFSG